MQALNLLQGHLTEACPTIHATRLQSVIDVAAGLQASQNLTLTSMARKLPSAVSIKQKIKKVDRLEGNKHLHAELEALYEGLSGYIFKYLQHARCIPVVVDLCYLKDNRAIQMLSAEVAVKGRSLPIYREVFKTGELKGRAEKFLTGVEGCLPAGSSVVLIMDAGFGSDWLKAIESKQWHWVLRVRQGKSIKLSAQEEWMEAKAFFPQIGTRAKQYSEAYIIRRAEHRCRLITKKSGLKHTKSGYKRQPRNYNAGNGDYRRSAKEPWILASNLPMSYTTTQILNYYRKRMQIEESFRDVKSHQFGLGARYARTECVYRWGVKLLLAAIVQIVYWLLGVIGHSQGFQKVFQANTVKDKKLFSYFYLGKLIVEHDMIKELEYTSKNLAEIIEKELAREW